MSKHLNTVATNDKNEEISVIGHYNDNLQTWEFWQVMIVDLVTLKKVSHWFAGNEFRIANELFDEIL